MPFDIEINKFFKEIIAMIRDIYGTMKAAGLTNSQVDFSRIWLGRSDRYYSHLIAVGHEPGLATLCGIKWRLEQLRSQSKSAPDPTLLELQHQIASEIERRAITDRRHRVS